MSLGCVMASVCLCRPVLLGETIAMDSESRGGGGEGTIIRPACVDVLGSFYECVPLHFPLMYLSVFHLICVLLIFIQNVFCIFIMCLLLYYGHVKSVCSIVIIHLLNSFFRNHRSRCLIFEYTLIYLFVLNNLFILRQ